MSVETVRTLEAEAHTLKLSRSDICRYLGLGHEEPDDALKDLIEHSLPEFLQAVRLRGDLSLALQQPLLSCLGSAARRAST